MSNRDLDKKFKDKLGNWEPQLPSEFWDKIREKNELNGRYHSIDDQFHDFLSDFKQTPLPKIWKDISSKLDNEYHYADSIREHQPPPPDWVWKSIRHLLNSNQKRRTYIRYALYSFITLGALLGTKQLDNYNSYFTISNSKGVNKILQVLDLKSNNKRPESYLSFYKKFAGFLSSASTINEIQGKDLLRYNQDENSNNILNINKIDLRPHYNIFKTNSIKKPGFSTDYKNRKPTPPVRKWRYAMDILVSTDVLSRQTFEETNEHAMLVKNSRAMSIKTKSAGLRIGLQKERWVFSLGAMVNQVNISSIYNFEIEKEYSFSTLFKDTANNYFTIVDKEKKSFQHSITLSNRYYSFSIPLRVGYHIKTGSISITPALAFRADFITSVRGNRVEFSEDPDQISIVPITKTQVNKFNLVGTSSLGVSYPVTQKFSLLIEPYINIHILGGEQDNFNKPTYGFYTGISRKF